MILPDYLMSEPSVTVSECLKFTEQYVFSVKFQSVIIALLIVLSIILIIKLRKKKGASSPKSV
jgi:hypothetical protein